MLAFLSQGGAGLYVTGVANLNGCQVYDNQAYVRAPVPGPILQRPAGTLHVLAFFRVFMVVADCSSILVARHISMAVRCTTTRLRCVLA